MTKNNISIAVIGYGYWGPNLLRNFNNNSSSTVELLVDTRQDRLNLAQETYRDLKVSTNFNDAITDNSIDAIVIATPVFTHYQIAKKALESGKHVLIEKPFTSDVKQAEELIEISKSKSLTLMVDHTFLYTGAIRKIKEYISDGHLGKIQYFDSTRINLGLIQQDVNVLWDLAPHDISILSYIIGKEPVSVQAIGTSHIHNDIENIAFMTVKYDDSTIAHFNCSWSSPVKVRKIMIGGDKKMIMFDDNEPTEKIKIYDTGFSIKNDEDKRKVLVDYRVGDIYVPKISNVEALSEVAKDFCNSIINKSNPISDMYSGLKVVKILAAAQESIKNNGKIILI